ncbi:MAG TPA: efflux RND transporter periplasmic adaptor subunit [Dongiaceae bacterium]|nr:efflux RND transporter periplasmic adaptor subunit [Dongiaceae bacterium]
MNSESKIDPTSVQQMLDLGDERQPRRPWRWWALGAAVGLLLLFWFSGGGSSGKDVRYVTQPVQRGNLDVIVTATGNLEPTNQVDVGTEVSGTITQLHADFNDHVEAGQLLAALDTGKLEAQLLATKASLESARAKQLQAEATVEESENELKRMRQVHELSKGRMPSQSDLDTATATLKRAQADKASAKASVAQAQAALELDQTNLAKAKVHSPISGVVLNRAVELGQTVAATFEAPLLFTLAEDLTKMELHVGVDEADVGLVKAGQSASFTVDAYANRRFPAQILQVRYGSQEVDGVITYETVLNVDNRDLSLRPGMTATAEIIVQQVKDAVLVPMAALRYSPPTVGGRENAGPSQGGGNIFSRLMPRPRPAQTKKVENTGKQQRVWVLRDGEPQLIDITTGADNGTLVEVTGGELDESVQVITESVSAAK